MGNPETLCSRMSWRARPTVSPGPRVMGSLMTPLAERLTLETSRAWASIGRLRWMKPMPPSCASAMARADSVTVSIGAETRGMRREMVGVRRVEVSASAGMTSE